MSDLRRLWQYVLRQQWGLLGAGVASVSAAACMAGALSLSKLLPSALGFSGTPEDVVAPTAKGPPKAVLAGEWFERVQQTVRGFFHPIETWFMAAPLSRGAIAILALYLLKGVFDYLAEYGMQRIGLRLVASLRSEVYAKLLKQSDAYFRVNTQGDLMSRVTGDTARLQRILGTDIGQLVQSIPVVIVMLCVAMLNTWQVTSFCLLVIPVFVFVAGRLGHRVKKSARRSQERAGQLSSVIEETLLARRVVQAFGAEEYEERRFASTLRGMIKEELRTARANAIAPPVMEILAAFTFVAVLGIAVWMMKQGQVAGPDIAISLIALSVSFVHVRRLGRLYASTQQALAAARRVFEVLDEPVVVQDLPNARNLDDFKHSIELREVSFSYGRGPVLSDVSLTIRRGELHALVGPSGAGKTTLAMLLPRFFDPSSGSVCIDHLDVRELTLKSLRRKIALVTQETHLFDGSVEENIAYGQSQVDEAAIRSAAQDAFADEFITQLPRGYQTALGERGSALSAGQRQRIAIARAFLKDAPILVLDEATSSLDSESEQRIQAALRKLLIGRTALVIAHRLSTVTRADRIHVLHKGAIVESGNHNELVARGGRYARLVALQRGGSETLDLLDAVLDADDENLRPPPAP